MAVANSSNCVKSHLYLKLNGQATLLCYISLLSGYLGDTEVKQLNSTYSLLDPSVKDGSSKPKLNKYSSVAQHAKNVRKTDLSFYNPTESRDSFNITNNLHNKSIKEI